MTNKANAPEFWCSPRDVQKAVENMREVTSLSYWHSGGGCGTIYINGTPGEADEYVMVGPFDFGSPYGSGNPHKATTDVSVSAWDEAGNENIYSSYDAVEVTSTKTLRAAIKAACVALAAFRAAKVAK